jgi:hypothetical protein
MGRVEKELEAHLVEWEQSGRSDVYLLGELSAAIAKLWLARNPERDPDGRYVEIIDASLAGVEFDIWRVRAFCVLCGERNKLENMATCVECRDSICWACPTQNGVCKCGGQLI